MACRPSFARFYSDSYRCSSRRVARSPLCDKCALVFSSELDCTKVGTPPQRRTSRENREMRLPFKLPRNIQVYRTSLGVQVVGDSRNVLTSLPKNSIDLIVTSPPFALLRQKSYGNKAQHEYVQWLMEFGKAALPKLKESGSFVLDLGGAYQRGKPVRSLYNFRVLTEFCDTLGYHLAEEFFWFNPAKLPSPIEWVNKRKIRTKDAVNTVWWFSKTEHPKADVTKVLVPYSKRMRALLEDPDKFYKPKERPSGHDIAKAFGKNNGGSIPPNLLNIPNTDSNSHYLRTCQALGRKRHPARYPLAFPQFFLKFLTDPGDVVIDIFILPSPLPTIRFPFRPPRRSTATRPRTGRIPAAGPNVPRRPGESCGRLLRAIPGTRAPCACSEFWTGSRPGVGYG